MTGRPSSIASGAPLPLPLAWRGKVREVYSVGEGELLLVASDRISAFDVVLQDPIPHKGAVLTQITAWWLRALQGVVPHHMLASDIDEIVERVPRLRGHEHSLRGRSMLCRKTTVFPVECVIRGYLAGSAWKEYRATGTLAGEALPDGLRESDRLEPPVFSPATKAVTGHDENITVKRMAEIVGEEAAAELERRTRAVYEFGTRLLSERGIIIADTKFEFGMLDGEILLVDEVLTPDSSRFWPAAGYSPGRPQESFDKQPLRDYLDALRNRGEWNGEYPAPRLSPEVIQMTSDRYRNAFERITGIPFSISGT